MSDLTRIADEARRKGQRGFSGQSSSHERIFQLWCKRVGDTLEVTGRGSMGYASETYKGITNINTEVYETGDITRITSVGIAPPGSGVDFVLEVESCYPYQEDNELILQKAD